MKRYLIATLLVFLIGFGGFASAPPAQAHHRPGPCDLHWRRAWITRHDVGPIKAIIRCAANRWGISASKALAVAGCETGYTYRPDATSPSGTYRGIFQHSRFYWPGRYADFTFPSWGLLRGIYNARTQAIVTARMVARYGWSPWSCA